MSTDPDQFMQGVLEREFRHFVRKHSTLIDILKEAVVIFHQTDEEIFQRPGIAWALEGAPLTRTLMEMALEKIRADEL